MAKQLDMNVKKISLMNRVLRWTSARGGCETCVAKKLFEGIFGGKRIVNDVFTFQRVPTQRKNGIIANVKLSEYGNGLWLMNILGVKKLSGFGLKPNTDI